MRALMAAALVVGAASVARADTTITQAQLESLRKAGDADLDTLDASESIEVNVCVTKKGAVSTATVVTSTGKTVEDVDIVDNIEKTWRFRPYKQGKKAIAVCADMKLVAAPPPPPPPPKVETVTPDALEANRVSGKIAIAPDKATRATMKKDGKTRVVVPFKLCVDEHGKVTQVTILKSSGYPVYDDRITKTAKKWKYKPFLVNGAAAPVCTAVTIIYQL